MPDQNLTTAELDELLRRRNQDFDGEAHLTNEELARLVAAARRALKQDERIRLREQLLAAVRTDQEETPNAG